MRDAARFCPLGYSPPRKSICSITPIGYIPSTSSTRSSRSDDVSIDLPVGWQISTIPQPQKLDAKAIVYSLETKNDKGTLRLSRELDVDVLVLPQQNYATLRKVFQVVRTGDEQQVILQPGASTASN